MLQSTQIFVDYINSLFVGKEPWQICSITAVTILIGIYIWNLQNQSERLHVTIKKKLFNLLRKVPFMSKTINEEIEKANQLFKNEIKDSTKELSYRIELPNEKLNTEKILEDVRLHTAVGKYDWQSGSVSGTVYYYEEELVQLLSEVYKMTSYSNPMHQDIFPGICKMEAEIVKIVLNLFHGGDHGCGVMTSGGTESIIMACKAYRDYAREIKGIEYPEIILSKTAHAAFDKAGSYLRMRLKHIDFDMETICVNINDMRKAITKNTVMLVGSTPNFPYGTADDIEQIAKLGQKYNIPVHVDCCLGSFVVAFMKEAGYQTPKFDFLIPGVTSISVDTHKYGFAPKGTSVILYSDPKYRQYQYYTNTSWTGGLYASPSISGSRSGAAIATCWATMMYFGRERYLQIVQKIMTTTKYVLKEIKKIPGIFIFGEPFSTVIAIGSNKFHIYRLADELGKKKWNLNMLQFPLGIHICITHMHTLPGVADKFLNDVKNAVEDILQNLDAKLCGKVAMYGMSTTLSDRTMVEELTKCYLDALYFTPNQPTN